MVQSISDIFALTLPPLIEMYNSTTAKDYNRFLSSAPRMARPCTICRRTVCVLPKSGYYVHIISDFGNTLL